MGIPGLRPGMTAEIGALIAMGICSSRGRFGGCILVRVRLHMGAAVAIFVAQFIAIFLSFLPLMMSGKEWRAEQERARARRMAEHRMNARLLRLNL